MAYLEDVYVNAVAAVDNWLRSICPGGLRRDQEQLKEIGFGSYAVGWEIFLPGSGSLLVLVDHNFPYSLPRIAARNMPEVLQWPHIEKTGLLCLAPDDAPVASGSPEALVSYVLNEARALLMEDSDGEHVQDFVVDFEAYWRRAAISQPKIFSLVDLRTETRVVKYYHLDRSSFSADSTEGLRRWLANRYGPSDDYRKIKDGLFVWLNNIPPPDQYPNDYEQLENMLHQYSPEAVIPLRNLVAARPKQLSILLAGEAPDGRVVYAGLSLLLGRSSTDRDKNRFNSKSVEPPVVRRVTVERVDAFSERSDEAVVRALSDKKIVVIGCGSLGASIVRILVQSGVRHLDLIDSDELTWVNIGRHELGGRWVGASKAVAMARYIKEGYPHVQNIRGHSKDWRDVFREAPNLFASADLILSLTGSWNAEAALNGLQKSGAFEAPIIYGWLEDRAAACHALLLRRGAPCLQCGFDQVGNCLIPVTIWPDKKAPDGCGGAVSIYGAAELTHAHGLIAGMALDSLIGQMESGMRRVWIAPMQTLERGAGEWNPDWQRTYGDPKFGGSALGCSWRASPGCSVCGGV